MFWKHYHIANLKVSMANPYPFAFVPTLPSKLMVPLSSFPHVVFSLPDIIIKFSYRQCSQALFARLDKPFFPSFLFYEEFFSALKAPIPLLFIFLKQKSPFLNVGNWDYTQPSKQAWTIVLTISLAFPSLLETYWTMRHMTTHAFFIAASQLWSAQALKSYALHCLCCQVREDIFIINP